MGPIGFEPLGPAGFGTVIALLPLGEVKESALCCNTTVLTVLVTLLKRTERHVSHFRSCLVALTSNKLVF